MALRIWIGIFSTTTTTDPLPSMPQRISLLLNFDWNCHPTPYTPRSQEAKTPRASFEELFQKFDTDGDGNLDEEEFAAFFQNFMVKAGLSF